MKSLNIGDQEMGDKEIAVTVASMVLGVGIIVLPRRLAETTTAIDGWMSILIAGIVVSIFTYIAAKLASRFPNQSFLQYASRIVSKPVAHILMVIYGVYALINVSIQMRAVGSISKIYLFEETPMPIITLAFLIVIVYAVLGARTAILKLNMMFFPIVFIVAVAICAMNVTHFEFERARPFFTTGWSEIFQGSLQLSYSIIGFEVVLIYMMYMKQFKRPARASVIGVNLVIGLYLLIYLTCILAFGRDVTMTLVYPTVELAKQSAIPGEFLERLESFFFTVWVMTIFNTSAMSYDIAIKAVHSIVNKGKKIVYVSILSPIVYVIGMFPQTLVDFIEFGAILGYVGIFLGTVMPAGMLAIAKIRGIGDSGNR